MLDPYFYAYNPELLAFENAWVNFIKSSVVNESVIKPVIAASWERCREMNLNPVSLGQTPVIPKNELMRKLSENQLILKTVVPFMESLYEIVKGSGFIIDFIDAEGYILKSIGDSDTLKICEKTSSVVGAKKSEDVAGTNGIALALITKTPVQVAGAEHYLHELHRWTCSAAPILDDQGVVLGVLNVAGRYEMIHQHTLGMVSSMAKAVENELRIQKMNEQLIENNSQLRATMETVTEGIIYVTESKITQINRRMCHLVGKVEEELIGKAVCDEILTMPDLGDVMDLQNVESEKIILNGKYEKYSCLIDVKSVYGNGHQETGKVLIIKRVDEIKVLASKIKNQATYCFRDIIGHSKLMSQAIELAYKAADHNVRVVIEGESGTGKEMFAQAIHNMSVRKDNPFIAVDCGALPIELLESELFGYEEGAFTGAKKGGKPGVFELANGGTLFFDEIGNMPMEMQKKLLRVLQQDVILRIGGTKIIPVDVRVIAATNDNLEDKVSQGTFRSDLFYRLNVMHIQTPSLKNRTEDIPLLIDNFLRRTVPLSRKIRMDKKAMNTLISYDWPGNVRQLNNTIEHAVIMCKGSIIHQEDLPLELRGALRANYVYQDEQMSLDQAMGEYIRKAVEINGGNVTRTAKLLKISRTTVYKALGKETFRYESE